MIIKEFNRPTCREVRAAVEAKLAELGAELGLSILSKGGGTFTPDNLTFKVECAVLNPNGEVQSRAASDFKDLATTWGLKVSDLGKSFTAFRGKIYTVVGAKPRSYKRPILAERSDGKVFKFAPSDVRRYLENS